MNCTEFLKLIKFILHNNYFQFNSNFYRQKFGSAMGNPLSPILSNIVMEDLENSCINKLQEKSLFYYLYVDDIVLCISKNNIPDTLHIFNSYDKTLQFTEEHSENNSISFFGFKNYNKR